MAFEIEVKEDSPEKLAAVQGKPTKHYLFAGELMALVDYVNSLADAQDLPNVLNKGGRKINYLIGDYFLESVNRSESLIINNDTTSISMSDNIFIPGDRIPLTNIDNLSITLDIPDESLLIIRYNGIDYTANDSILIPKNSFALLMCVEENHFVLSIFRNYSSFLSSNAAEYSEVTLPLSNSELIVVFQDGVWKRVTIDKLKKTKSSIGSLISFVELQIYNSISSPSTSNITNDLTGAQIGVVQKIYHNSDTAPTFPPAWVKLSGTYTNSAINIIYAEWCEGARVEYWIVKG